MLRPLNAKELALVKGTLKEARAYYDANTEAATQLISLGDSKPSDTVPAPQLAAMALVANELMNLDETLNK